MEEGPVPGSRGKFGRRPRGPRRGPLAPWVAASPPSCQPSPPVSGPYPFQPPLGTRAGAGRA